ncbi:expansin family [Pyrrhoderma noxium]|uniref:Expansin family n=1 Tax=Pyrrhoderma noxium TaxID=2282107 RepID=A0A286U4T0_9AGAM|nr:expansin family [Pyrrhoderma noxium]
MILPTSAGMTIIFTLLCFPLLVFSSPISSGNFDHHKRVIAANSHSLAKRFDNARYTWYDITTGETACGQWYQKSDYVVALDAQQYGGGENCFKQISISANGKTTTAQIVDECPSCPWGALDVSEGLFEFFAPLDAGEIYGSWNFI